MLKRHYHITVVLAKTLFDLTPEYINIIVMKVHIGQHIFRKVFGERIVEHLLIGLKSIQKQKNPPNLTGNKIAFIADRIYNPLLLQKRVGFKNGIANQFVFLA